MRVGETRIVQTGARKGGPGRLRRRIRAGVLHELLVSLDECETSAALVIASLHLQGALQTEARFCPIDLVNSRIGAGPIPLDDLVGCRQEVSVQRLARRANR